MIKGRNAGFKKLNLKTWDTLKNTLRVKQLNRRAFLLVPGKE